MHPRSITLAAALLGAGCGPAVGLPSDSSSGTGEMPTSNDTTTGAPTTEGTTSIVTTTGEDPSSSGSSTGEPLDGPGCGVVPTCDRGELVGSMRVESSAQIEDIAGYTSVTGWLEITGSDLECLDFLACLTTVGQDVRVADNPQLRSLAGTDAIAVVGVADENEEGAVIVAHNDAMRVLAGFGSLERIESLIVSDNAALERIAGFELLVAVEGTLSIRFHPNLVDLGPLDDLAALGDDCQITNNPSLCLSEPFAVCGDLDQGGDAGNTNNNDETCLGDAPPGFLDSGSYEPNCHPWAQDCPPGEKCTWWANDGGSAWNATRCVPIDPDAGGVGESCTVQGSGVSGLDSCDVGLMCWDVDPETNTGACVGFCLGSESTAACAHADELCRIGGDGLALCLPTCHPLAQDCGPEQGCWQSYEGFMCMPDASGEMGALGDPCEFINVCDPGLACLEATAVPGCAGAGCCSEYCDLDAPSCSFPEQECVAAYEPAATPWGYEDAGVCMVP